MPHRLNLVPDLCLLLLGLTLQAIVTRWIWELPGWRSRVRRTILVAGNVAYATLACTGYLVSFHRLQDHLPVFITTWIQAVSLILDVFMIGAFLAIFLCRRAPGYSSPRREFLRNTSTAVAIAPLVGVAFGILIRDQFQMKHVKVRIANLPKDLEGLRLVQITDIHLSPFLSESQLARAIDMANEAKAHVALVTGDLITRLGDPLDSCLRQLGRLRAEGGVLGCLGNHEVYTRSEAYVAQQGKRIGVGFLRHEARSLRFGNASINFAGVDYQPFGLPYLAGMEKLIAPGQVNVMLSHNPDVFPVAASQGYDLTLAGHTHGGQVNFEILHRNVNVALAFTPFVRGLYERGASSAYVSSGIGTIGVPVRVGAPAEVSLIELCAS